MKRLPRWIRARLTVDGRPVSGLAISITVKATRKNSFDSIWGPSDVDGEILVKGADLLRQSEAEAQLFIMDYGRPEHDGAGRIEVSVEDVDALGRAIEAHDRFAEFFPYPPGYREMLVEAKRRIATLGT